MSHAASPVTKKDVPAIVTAAPFKVAPLTTLLLWVFVAVGIFGFFIGLRTGDPKSTWAAFHVNFVYWFCVAAASSCFSAVFQICNAQWVRPIRRLFEAALPYFLFSLAPLAVMYIGHYELFSWSHEQAPGRGNWMSTGWVFARQVAGIIVLWLLARKVIHASLRRDIGVVRSGLTGLPEEQTKRWFDKAYDCYVKGWGADTQRELREATETMGYTSPVVVIVYALVMTFFAIDLIMSVDVHWYSTLFGAFVFMAAVYLAFAWTSIGIFFARRAHPLFLAKIHRSTLWDHGKLMFGFGIFWAYLFWSHYLTIWYGNIPEETGWVITRMRLEPWHTFGWFILAVTWLIPFALGLSRDVKQVPALLCLTATFVAVGQWCSNYLLFVPTLYPDSIPLQPTDFAITLGFLGAYALSAISFLKRVPLMPFGDFYLE